MKLAITMFLFVAFAAFLYCDASAAIITIGAGRDATIFQSPANNSSGAGNGLFAGTNGQGSVLRGLVAFDIAGAFAGAGIPTTATITDVQVTLFLGQVAGSGGGGPGGPGTNPTIGLHRLTANWGEGLTQKQNPPNNNFAGQAQGAAAGDGDATWNARFFSATSPTLWAAPGGDFAAAARATAVVGTTLNVGYNWGSTTALVDDVQSWLAAPSSNFGWMLVNSNETVATTFRAFYTRDAASSAFHPQLHVTYEVVPEPSGFVLAMLAGLIALALRWRAAPSIAVLSILALSSCAKSMPPTATKQPLVFSTAASTKDVIEKLAEKFKADTGVEIRVNPGPTNGLATQILAGVPADLFLSASQQWADEVEKGGQTEMMVRLLTNRLVIVVPKGNPAQVREPKDLLSPNVKRIALAGENVPAGVYADQALTKLDLLKQLVDGGKIARGQDVRTALAYVERGEAEAGIVYATDVGMAQNVESVYEFDPGMHDEIVYVLVLLKHANGNPAAKRLYEFLQTPTADGIYAQFGFSRI